MLKAQQTAVYPADTPLYDLSATEIRPRPAAGLSWDDLVPPAGLAFIYQHHFDA